MNFWCFYFPIFFPLGFVDSRAKCFFLRKKKYRDSAENIGYEITSYTLTITANIFHIPANNVLIFSIITVTAQIEVALN